MTLTRGPDSCPGLGSIRPRGRNAAARVARTMTFPVRTGDQTIYGWRTAESVGHPHDDSIVANLRHSGKAEASWRNNAARESPSVACPVIVSSFGPDRHRPNGKLASPSSAWDRSIEAVFSEHPHSSEPAVKDGSASQNRWIDNVKTARSRVGS